QTSFWLDYYIAGTTRYPDTSGEPTKEDAVIDAVDAVPRAPGLITPEGDLTSQALFRLQWPDGTRVTFGVILPRADQRTAPVGVQLPAPPPTRPIAVVLSYRKSVGARVT